MSTQRWLKPSEVTEPGVYWVADTRGGLAETKNLRNECCAESGWVTGMEHDVLQAVITMGQERLTARPYSSARIQRTIRDAKK